MDPNTSNGSRPTVYVIDGDAAVRDSLCVLLAGIDAEIKDYHSAEAFLAAPLAAGSRCLIVEIHLPGMSGLELLEVLRQRQQLAPAIVLASDSDVPLAVQAMRLGAVDFIDKPFVDQVLLNRVRQALAGQLVRGVHGTNPP